MKRWWTLKLPSLKNSAEKPEMPKDGSWPWWSTSSFMWTSSPMKCELWFSSIGCPKDEEKPLLRLGSPSSKMNMLLMLTRTGPRSRKPSKLHLPPMSQQCRLKLLLPRSIKTGRIPQDLTSTSSSSPSSSSTPESMTITSC